MWFVKIEMYQILNFKQYKENVNNFVVVNPSKDVFSIVFLEWEGERDGGRGRKKERERKHCERDTLLVASCMTMTSVS